MSGRSISTCLEALAIALLAARARAEDLAPIDVSVQAAPPRREAGRVIVSAAQAREVPGTAGDPLKVVEALPGVGRASFDGGKLSLWGAGGARVYVDGVEIPALFHGGGRRGVIAGDLIQSVEVVPGAYGAEYGRGLGGVVRLRTRELPDEGIHGAASIDLLDAGALVSAAVGDRVRVAVGARASYLDRLVSRFAPRVQDVVPVPRYRDYQAKASIALRPAESIDLMLLGAGDDLDRAQPSPAPSAARRERTASSFHRAILRYSRLLEDGTAISVTPSLGLDREALDASFGDVPARRDEVAWRYGLRASAEVPITSALRASFGVDAIAVRSSLSRTGSLTIPAREGDLYVFGRPPGAGVASDRWTAGVVDAAPWAQLDIRLGPATITPGLRVDLSLIDAGRATPRVADTPAAGASRLAAGVDPRLAVRLALSDRLTLTAAAGLYREPPDPADLGAVFGTPALSQQRAAHLAAGPAARLAGGLTLEATGYFERLDALVVRSRLPAPKLAQALTQDGEGRSYGVQILLRQQPRRGLFGWIAYTAGRSERRYRGDPGYRLFDDDHTHALTAVASYTRAGWTAGARFRFTTGAPRTPVVGSFFEATTGVYQPIFGAQNSARLPDFYQLDLRIERRIQWPRVALDLYLDVLDATFHASAEEVVYNHDWTKKGYLTGLPFFAVLGARVEI